MAFNISTTFQFLIGGSFFYIYLRKSLRLEKKAALFGSLTYMYSGYNIANLHHLNVVQVLFCLPLDLLLIDQILKYDSKKGNPLIICKLLLSLIGVFVYQISAGHLESMFFISFYSGRTRHAERYAPTEAATQP
jgi:hypothetical protein